MKNIFLILLLGFELHAAQPLSQGDTQNQNFHTVPAIEISGLEKLKGQYISLSFVWATAPAISVDPLRMHVHKVKAAPKELLIDSNTALFSPTTIAMIPGFTPYNFLFIVVSPNPKFSWANTNLAPPEPDEYYTENHEVNYFKPVPFRVMQKIPLQNNVLRIVLDKIL